MSIVTFNNKRIPSFARVTDVNFDAIGDLSIQEATIPGRVGNIDAGTIRGGKVIQLTIKIIKDNKSIHQYADELKRWLIGDNWKPSRLVFGDQPDYYFMARVNNSININDLLMTGETSIDFYAADPIKYKVNHTNLNSIGNTIRFNYGGVEDAPLIITFEVQSGLSKITFSQDNTGRTTTIEGDFKTGDRIEIDADRKVIKINNEVDMNLVSLENKWLYATEGDNTVRTIHGVGSLKVTYQERN